MQETSFQVHERKQSLTESIKEWDSSS